MTFVKRSVKDDPYQLALETAYRILKARSRSENEIATRLSEKGIAPEIVDATLAKLKAQRYLDDRKLAQDLADKFRAKGESDAKVRERLLSRGLPEKDVADVLVAGKSDAPEDSRIWDALQKRAKTLKSAPPALQVRRLKDYLARQGYEPDTIELALERFIAESNFNEET